MTHSMTAFARQTVEGSWGSLSCELRSVNHRYLELSVRLPEALSHLEMQLRERIKHHVARGKVECQVRYHSIEAEGPQFEVNHAVAKMLIEAVKGIDAHIANPAPLSALDVLRWPEVLQSANKTESADLQPIVLEAIDRVLAEFAATRQREGTDIQKHFFERLDAMMAELTVLKQRLPVLHQQQRTRMMARLADANVTLDAGRVEQEMVIYAQKSDVAEEIERLEAHIVEVRRVLTEGGLVGRRLDFLMQEMNREANTLGSKSADLESTRASVELKVLIEQMREQVQNVE